MASAINGQKTRGRTQPRRFSRRRLHIVGPGELPNYAESALRIPNCGGPQTTNYSKASRSCNCSIILAFSLLCLRISIRRFAVPAYADREPPRSMRRLLVRVASRMLSRSLFHDRLSAFDGMEILGPQVSAAIAALRARHSLGKDWASHRISTIKTNPVGVGHAIRRLASIVNCTKSRSVCMDRNRNTSAGHQAAGATRIHRRLPC